MKKITTIMASHSCLDERFFFFFLPYAKGQSVKTVAHTLVKIRSIEEYYCNDILLIMTLRCERAQSTVTWVA